jgi:hypothetical protein
VKKIPIQIYIAAIGNQAGKLDAATTNKFINKKKNNQPITEH